jgi:uncharacterized membrane protein
MQGNAPEPTPDEKTMALIVYLVSIFAGFIPPLIIYLLKRDSKFVAFHSLQVLIWHIGYLALTLVMVAAFIVSIFASIAASAGHTAPHQPPPFFFIIIPFFYIFIMLGWLVNLIIGVVFGIQAHKGEWPAIPIIGGWARRMAGV